MKRYSVFAALSEEGEYPYALGIGSPEERSRFTSDDVVLGDRSRVWDTRYHLEAAAHGCEEGTVESALGGLCQVDDINRTSINGLRCKST
jgi:hypothetical protein